MVIDSRFLNNVGRVSGNPVNPAGQRKVQPQTGFDSILQEQLGKTGELKFSKHAELRLQSRNIRLTSQQKEKINEAVSKAQTKGVKDSLILMDNMAFVVSVKNRTVITAVNSNELQDNVFTNIDGAVIA